MTALGMRHRIPRLFFFIVADKELYKRIKIAGMLSFIPLMLAAGPLAGYVIGDFLQKRFAVASWGMWICIGLGAAASVRETIRIIRRVIRIERN